MKKIYFCYLLFLNIFISATPIEEINIFFTNDLTFVQTSLNKIDNSFDKSGFIPEMDFSHFFQRIDFDRSLNNFFDSPELHPEPSIREERVGKEVHNYINVIIIFLNNRPNDFFYF